MSKGSGRGYCSPLMSHARRSTPWVAVGVAFIGIAYALTGADLGRRAAPWAMVGGLAALFVGSVALGAKGRGAAATRYVVGACLLIGFGAALLVPGHKLGPMGVPVGTLLVALLVGVIPIVGLPVIFALSSGDDREEVVPPVEGSDAPRRTL